MKTHLQSPTTYTDSALTIFSQHDPRWKNERFSNGFNIGNHGAALTCAATLFHRYNPEMTPKLIAQRSQFTENGKIYWGSLEKIDNKITFCGRPRTRSAFKENFFDYQNFLYLLDASTYFEIKWYALVGINPVRYPEMLVVADPLWGSIELIPFHQICGGAIFKYKMENPNKLYHWEQI